MYRMQWKNKAIGYVPGNGYILMPEQVSESVMTVSGTEERGERQLENLLHECMNKTGCLYLSDLHQPDRLVLVKHALYKMDPDRYSIREWTDAVNYITGQSLCFKDLTEAVEYLETYTSQPGSREKKGEDQRQ